MSDVIEVVLIMVASLIGFVLFGVVGLCVVYCLDEWDDQKARERCVACQSDLPLICLTIARPPFDLCDSHYKRYNAISKLEYDTDMWKRGQA